MQLKLHPKARPAVRPRAAVRRPSRAAAVLATLVCASALTACGQPVAGVGAPDGDKVVITLSAKTWNAGLASLAVSEKRGYFADENLNVSFVLLDGATIQAQQVATNNATVGAITPEPVIFGDQPGKRLNLRYFSSFYRKNIYGLRVPAGSPIKSLADLRGKKIGAASLGSASVTNVQVALQDAGIPKSAVTFVAIGTGAQQATALKNRDVDAVALFDTQFQILENNGVPLRRIPLPKIDELAGGGLVATSANLRRKPELYARIGRAVAKGVVFAQENPTAAINDLYAAHPQARNAAIPLSKARANDTKVLTVRMQTLGVQPGEQQWGILKASELQRNIDYMKRAGLITQNVDVNDIFTSDLTAEINKFDPAPIRAAARAART
ncbi:ABC transporter substrate-binding protein [Spirillospora sp. NPDC048911]|uniref:ABC transporter substrate-binding protein n=1 Tax=Spirillospora sp. NPDC048911 TaxID=3364527 RepID=UPI0037233AAA